MAVPEAVVRSAPPTVQVTAPDMGRTEGDVAEGSPDVAAVAERTGGESSLAPTLGGSHSPAQDEPLVRWVNPQDFSSTLFTLDDVAKGMERESLNKGIAAVLEALNHAWGALCDVVVPTGRVFT